MFCTYLTRYSGDKLPPYYIGSSSVLKILNGYKGSVSSKKYKNIWDTETKEHPELFKTEILVMYKTRDLAMQNELDLHVKWNVVKSDKFINLSLACKHGCFGRSVKGKDHPMYGVKHSELSKAKMSASQKGFSNGPHSDKTKAKISAGNKGKVYSDETLAKMSIVKKGKTASAETKAKMSVAQKGRLFSEEHRAKISASLKNRIFSEEHRAKMSMSKKGTVASADKAKMSVAQKDRIISDETKSKISASGKGRIFSEEHRAKISASHKGKQFFNNGVISKMFKECPEGFVKGRLKK